MKKKFEAPEITVMSIKTEDILTASSNQNTGGIDTGDGGLPIVP